jgi:hypothetical protein
LSFSIFIVPIRLSHIALSSASPTVPMLPTRPSLASRFVNANEVYCEPWSEWWTAPAEAHLAAPPDRHVERLEDELDRFVRASRMSRAARFSPILTRGRASAT